MPHHKTRIQELFTSWFNGTLSDAERLELEQHAAKEDFDAALPQLLREQWDQLQATEDFTLEKRQLLGKRITDKYPAEQPTPVRPIHRVHFLRKWGWAAAIVIAIGTYLFTTNTKKTQPDGGVVNTIDIPPGKDGAVLSLADGTQVLLDTIHNGTIALQGGAIAKVVNGALQYEANGDEVVFNTMSTPRGKQYHVILPDGTEVWLNAASSIRYPTVFTGKERKVTMTGEAYFEVAKNGQMPFVVSANGKADIQVLGTHFNINAYSNEDAIRTTLLEGMVRMRSEVGGRKSDEKPQTSDLRPQSSIILSPGQQASLKHDQLTTSNNVDIDKVMAWKNGLFNFEGATLEEVMKQLERWYDIEVVYEKGIPDIEFGGEMTKNISLKGLLLVLEKSDIHFRLEGRKLVVLP